MAEEAQSVEDSIIDQVFGPEQTEEAPTPSEDENAPESGPEEGQADDSEADSEEPTEEEFVDIEFEGKVYAVPPELKEAFARESDYTQKTQRLAAERKETEVLRATALQAQKQQEFAQSIQAEAGQLQTLDWQIQQYREYMRANVDSLSGNDLEKIRFHIEDAKAKKEELTASLQNKWTEHQQAQQQAEKELLAKSTEVLRTKISNWSEAEEKAVIDYARQNGFSEDEVKYARFDPRQLVLAHKAMRFDKLQEGKVTALKKLDGKPSIRAKARDPMPASVRKKLDLNNKLKSKELSQADKAKLIGEDLADFVLGER